MNVRRSIMSIARSYDSFKNVMLHRYRKDDEIISFICNICGHKCKSRLSDLDREIPSCNRCGSNVRFRWIIHVLSIELFNESKILSDFPYSPDIIGVGMSDWVGYAGVLSNKLGYTNTFYDQEPKLDITSIDSSYTDKYDFIISSDVFEHVNPPVSIAFDNCYKILKPGGVMIFSVPYSNVLGSKTIEYYPDLYKYQIVKENGQWVLENTAKDGTRQEFRNLEFHGGPGQTLAMRLFSEDSLIEEFKKAGFKNIRIRKEPYIKYGIRWEYDGSYVITANK